ADPVPPERGLELRDVRHHEAQLGGLVRKLALQVEEVRARNMAFLEGAIAGHDDIGNGAAFSLVVEIARAVEHAQVRLGEETGEFLGRDQPATLRHVSLPYVIAPDARAFDPPK